MDQAKPGGFREEQFLFTQPLANATLTFGFQARTHKLEGYVRLYAHGRALVVRPDYPDREPLERYLLLHAPAKPQPMPADFEEWVATSLPPLEANLRATAYWEQLTAQALRRWHAYEEDVREGRTLWDQVRSGRASLRAGALTTNRTTLEASDYVLR